MSRILKLEKKPLKPNPELIEILEDWLVKAKTGELTGLAAIGFTADLEVLDVLKGDLPQSEAVYSLERFKFQLLAEEVLDMVEE